MEPQWKNIYIYRLLSSGGFMITSWDDVRFDIIITFHKTFNANDSFHIYI